MRHPWTNSVGGSKILASIIQAEKKLFPSLDEGGATASACRMLNILYAELRVWKLMFAVGKQNLTRMTPKEHEDALGRLNKDAHRLLEGVEALNLPVNILAYYPEIWPDIENRYNDSDFESDLHLLLKLRNHGTPITTWLNILADEDRVKNVAPTSPLRKANLKNPELVYTVRMMARFFQRYYGKRLPSTIERICFIEFPEADVSNNTITAILRNFDAAS